MKKLWFILILSCVSVTGHSQTLKQIALAKKQEEMAMSAHKITPPIMVRAAFAKDYPGKDVIWKKERGHFEANFSAAGKNMAILYGEGGNRIESETIIKRSQMPSIVMDYIATHYRGETITETSIIKKSNGEENYEVEVKGINVLFTKEGKYIKAIKD